MTTVSATNPVTILTTISSRELLAKRLPPIRMIVGKHVPAGLLLLAGDPKVGKSLLVQDLALSVAVGNPAWGSLHVDAGDVLYIANEGGERSFRDRLVKMLGLAGDFQPDAIEEALEQALGRFHIAQTNEPLGARLEIQLEVWLNRVEDPRLIVIDTYSSVAPEGRGANRHQDDYNALAGLADLATRWPNTLFIVVHHTRKAEGEDVMHRISGSNGMAAATDGMAVLSRQPAANRCLLTIRPRNAEESELLMERRDDLRWVVVGEDERLRLSSGRQVILAWLDDHPEGGSPKVISEETGLDYDSVRQFLVQMEGARQVVKERRGWYKSSATSADE